jgi:hypothetical protein
MCAASALEGLLAVLAGSGRQSEWQTSFEHGMQMCDENFLEAMKITIREWRTETEDLHKSCLGSLCLLFNYKFHVRR